MLCRYKHYTGTEPYLFFSYCHKDADRVYPIIEQMAKDGYRIWYDDGIHPGEDWLEVIAKYLTNSAVCIAVISPESTSSHNCRSEINLSVELNKPIITIMLEDFELSLATRLQLGVTQYVRKYEFANSKAFYERLYSASALSQCCGEPIELPADPDEQEQFYVDELRKRKNDEEKARIRKFKEEHERIKIDPQPMNAGVKPEKNQSIIDEEETFLEVDTVIHDEKLEELKRKVELEEALRKAEDEARRLREKELDELKQKVEQEEARRKAEDEARLAREKKLEELKRKVEEEEARRKAEEKEQKRKAEEARLAREKERTELKRKAEAEEAARLAREKELEELKRKVEEEENRRKAEEEVQRRKAEEVRLAREKELEDLKRKVEAEAAHRKAEEAARLAREEELEQLRLKVEAEERHRKAEEMARFAREKELEELKQRIEAEECLRKAEAETYYAQEKNLEDLKRKVEAEEIRRKTEEEVRLAREKELEELKRKVETEDVHRKEEAEVFLARKRDLEELTRRVEEEEARRKMEEITRLAREKELEELRQKIEEEENRRKYEEEARLARDKNLEELKRKVEAEEIRRKHEQEIFLARERELDEMRRKAEAARIKAEAEARQVQERELDTLRRKLNELQNAPKPFSVEYEYLHGGHSVDMVSAQIDTNQTVIQRVNPYATVREYGALDRTFVEKKSCPAILVHLESATIYPLCNAETSIGRSPVSCDIVFPDNQGISRHHADIIRVNGRSYLRDMKAGNGTYLNGKQLEAGTSMQLENASWIQLHNLRLLYLSDVLAAYVVWQRHIYLLQNVKNNVCVCLTDEPLVLHRSQTRASGAFLDDIKISRDKHALVYIKKGRAYIRDLQSKNGTYIGENRLDSQREYPLYNGTNVRLGDTVLRCVDLYLKEGDD